MRAVSDYVLVMIEAIPYDGLMQRHQHLAREMSKYMQVIYAESTPSRIKRLFDGHPFDPRLNEYKKGLREQAENLYIFSAPPCVPRSYGYKKSIEATSQRTARALRPHIPKGKNVILWIFSPAGASAPGLYDEKLSIFDCFDAWGEFPGEERYRADIIEMMKGLASKVDIVMATSPELAERLGEFNKNTVLVRNGCDPEHFSKRGKIPEDSKLRFNPDRMNHPVIGYMGDIAPWLDMEDIYTAARRHPDWSFVLIGTWKRDGRVPSELSNVYTHDRVDYNELPYYVKCFDVGTIPFELTDLTRVVNPLKLYEYFSLGIPVVSTPIPEVVLHEGLVYIAGNPDEFAMLLELAVKERKDAAARSKRKEVAGQNSWKSRGENILDMIKQKLSI